MTTRRAAHLAGVAGIAFAVLGTPSLALATSGTMSVRVVDEDGQPRAGATVVACPDSDCDAAIGVETNAGGVARLLFPDDRAWSVFAFVSNPEPEWPCPGYGIGGDVLYLSEPEDALFGTPSELPRRATFTIVRQTIYDCAPLKVTDQAGQPIEGAVFWMNDGSTFATTDDGVVRVVIEPGESYDLQPYVVNWNAPCPAFEWEGDTFHTGDAVTRTAEELIDGETFIIQRPDPSDCEPVALGEVRLIDAQGHFLPAGVIHYCEYDPQDPATPPLGGDSCLDSGWLGVEGGVVQVPVPDPTRHFGIAGFLQCEAVDEMGNPTFEFGDYNVITDDGYSWWSIPGDQLTENGLSITFDGDVESCVSS